MHYQAVLFDMDGTVLDTLNDLFDSVNHSLAQFSLPPVSRELVRQSLGHGAAYLIRCCVPDCCSDEECARILNYYRPWYDAHCHIRTRPYDGIPELIRELRENGVRTAIISNKPDSAEQAVRTFTAVNCIFATAAND